MQTPTKQTKGALQLKEISIIPITTAAVTQQPQVEKPSSSKQSMADDESADSLRKKRCTDRYDSSESSDRYVEQLVILMEGITIDFNRVNVFVLRFVGRFLMLILSEVLKLL